MRVTQSSIRSFRSEFTQLSFATTFSPTFLFFLLIFFGILGPFKSPLVQLQTAHLISSTSFLIIFSGVHGPHGLDALGFADAQGPPDFEVAFVCVVHETVFFVAGAAFLDELAVFVFVLVVFTFCCCTVGFFSFVSVAVVMQVVCINNEDLFILKRQ